MVNYLQLFLKATPGSTSTVVNLTTTHVITLDSQKITREMTCVVVKFAAVLVLPDKSFKKLAEKNMNKY